MEKVWWAGIIYSISDWSLTRVVELSNWLGKVSIFTNFAPHCLFSGRRLTGQGRRDLDRIAAQIKAKEPKEKEIM